MNSYSIQATTKLLVSTLLAIGLFQLATQFRLPPASRHAEQSTSTVVISAPIQVLMYAGDRFLAANLEAMRVAAIGPAQEEALAGYRARAHGLVSQLNACHEDNLYLANAMLSWGGSADEGNTILQRATECRYWDEMPPFLLGFNRYFFFRDFDGAQQAIDIAAARSEENSTAFQHMSIAIASKKLNDEKMAAAYLRNQRDEATDQKLIKRLDRRLKRLEGLITLREAQAHFEKEHGRPLAHPNELLSSGILDKPPQDPMRIGYEFIDGGFRLKALKIGGMEIR
ncbi:MAG: hypothetical protein ABFS08_00390 [Pseudomonadota bacterium]